MPSLMMQAWSEGRARWFDQSSAALVSQAYPLGKYSLELAES